MVSAAPPAFLSWSRDEEPLLASVHDRTAAVPPTARSYKGRARARPIHRPERSGPRRAPKRRSLQSARRGGVLRSVLARRSAVEASGWPLDPIAPPRPYA